MDTKIKKLIAREGLIIISIIVLGSLVSLSSKIIPIPQRVESTSSTSSDSNNQKIYKLLDEIYKKDLGDSSNINKQYDNAIDVRAVVDAIGLGILGLSYPIYWLIRFIKWAILTLKRK